MIEHLNDTALNALPDDAPVVMLNLMRFRERSLDGNGSGWDAYLRYSQLTIKLIKVRGGTIIWTGDAEAVALGVPEAHRWDYVALVRYPSRAAFLDMMHRPNTPRPMSSAKTAVSTTRSWRCAKPIGNSPRRGRSWSSVSANCLKSRPGI
ncbi:MAG: hypothetical protein ACHQPH_04770 [Reyranellales bacterium]